MPRAECRGALLSAVLFVPSLPHALADLAGLQVGVGGTLGTMQLAASGLLAPAVLVHREAARDA